MRRVCDVGGSLVRAVGAPRSMGLWTLAFVLLGLGLSDFGQTAAAQGLTPDEAVQRMKVPEPLEVSVVAAEPLVRQPVAIEFDDRGRLWVIQYLQYPNPAGLKRVTVDRFSRTKYDRVPEPPPHGPRGADRITILEDRDGDGRMDRSHDFVDGLNLATGLAFGHGGVFVLNVPYLLFYPDANRDDVPDANPEVLLTGFGMEDAHSVANSLMFGPDGWLYGCQGSTVTSQIRGIEFQQGVWRYHPVTKQFELFCEGGGNSWGLDFDRTGRLLYSTNWGGHTLLHGVQGAYYIKSFGKHGALHNPHAYGYFEHAPHRNFRGGHVTVGGIVYQGDALPDMFRDRFIAGDLLGHGVYWHSIEPRGSTVQTAHGGELIVAQDPWFAPTDVTMGPDGAIYVSDWHDARTAHPDPDADWDRSNGRIYRLTAKGAGRPKAFDLSKQTDDELLALLRHRSQWFVRRARQELVRRFVVRGEAPVQADALVQGELATRASRVLGIVSEQAQSRSEETLALESLWTVASLGGFSESLATKLLDSPHSAVRSWTVRLLGDRGVLSTELAHRLDEFAEQEPDVGVRQQLACSAARFTAAQAMPMINANINRDIDNEDPFLPMLWWWAVEKHSVAGREEVLRRFVRPTLWKSRLGRDHLLPRLVRRYAAERSTEGLDAVVRLLKAAPSDAARAALWSPILTGWTEQPRAADDWPKRVQQHELFALVHQAWLAMPTDMTLLQLGLALGDPAPVELAIRDALDVQQPPARRAALLVLLSPVLERVSVADRTLVPRLLTLAEADEPEAVRLAAIQLLGRVELREQPALLQRIVKLHQTAISPALKSQVRDLLLGRASSARVWLEAVDRQEIPAAVTPLDQIRRVALLGDPSLDLLVTKHWGRLQSATPEEKLAEVRRLNNDLRAASGDAAAGQLLFKKNCATCHQLFGDGAKIGPDLTTANRQDRDFLLVSLVDPSSVIRKEFVSVVVQTTNGRVVTGLPIERGDRTLTLADSKGEKQLVPLGEIEELHDSPVSLMPDNLYRQFSPQQLRDLFAYLQSQR